MFPEIPPAKRRPSECGGCMPVRKGRRRIAAASWVRNRAAAVSEVDRGGRAEEGNGVREAEL